MTNLHYLPSDDVSIQKSSQIFNNVDDALANLDIDHGERFKSLDRLVRLAENIGESYRIANPILKREYLALFFSKIYVKDKKVVRYDLPRGKRDDRSWISSSKV